MNLSQSAGLPEIGNIYIINFVKRFDFISVTSGNLRKIREGHKLSQKELASMIGSTPGRVSGYETGADAMGTDYMERVCTALGDVRMWQFFIEEDTPIIRDDNEYSKVKLFREEEKLGVAEDIMKYEIYRIEDAKKKKHEGIGDAEESLLEKLRLLKEREQRRKKKTA